MFVGLSSSQIATASTLEGRGSSIATRLDAASLFMCEISAPSGEVATCGGEISIVESGSYNAWSKGGRVYLTRRLVDVSSDDELAYVMAHEMVHVILEHSQSSIRNELEADYWAAKIMNRAHFDANAAKTVLSRGQFRRILGFPFSLLSHPSNSRRLRTIRRALDEDMAFNRAPSRNQDGVESASLLSALP